MAAKEAAPTLNFLALESIEDDAVFLKKGGLRKIILTSGINVELLAEEELNALTYAYQTFLNSLDFSIQFVVHSRKFNTDTYLTKLDALWKREAHPLLKNQILEYKEFISTIATQNDIMTKTFFVVVPYDPILIPGTGKLLGMLSFGNTKRAAAQKNLDRAAALQQLSERTEQVLGGLLNMGVRAVALNTDELKELFYNLYNPEAVEKRVLPD